MSFMKTDNNENKKLGLKDIIIVIMSVVLLVLLILIVLLSRRQDQMIAQSLQDNSEFSTDDAVAQINSRSIDYLEISEVNSEKWLEIHNLSTDTIDISGLQIKVADKIAATLEEGSLIKKDDYFVVELNVNPGKEDSNVLTVLDGNGEAIRFLVVPRLSDDESYGIADSEKNVWGFIDVSKGKANSSKDVRYVENGGIAISAPGGFYNTSFELELLCEEGEKIYFTTDGTPPTTDSDLYENAIHITNNSGSKYVYARKTMTSAFSQTYMPGTIDAGTIVRGIKVDASGNVIGEMNQAYYVGLSKDSDYLDLPVISITTDPENLFDYVDGIYVAGKQREDAIIKGLPGEFYANYYNPWKKPSRVEYYESTKDKTFEMECTINISNDSSIASRQKGLTIELDKDASNEFAGSSILGFISSKGNINLTTNYEDNDLKIRNQLVNDLAEGMDIGLQKSQLCSVFLDGEYWGVYCIRADYDEVYFEERYGIVNEEIITRKANEYNDSYMSFYNFATQNDLAIQENYNQVANMMDIDNFIDYVCFNVFLGNSSFSPHSGTAWRTVSTEGKGKADGRWRFLCGDMSKTMYLTGAQTPTINTYLQPGIQGDLLFQSLLMNDEFCKKLEVRMKKIIEEYFEPENAKEMLELVIDLTKKPAFASYRRFTGNYYENQYSIETNRIELFFEERSEYIIQYTEELAQKGGDLQAARELLEQSQNNGENNEDNETELEQTQIETENSETDLNSENNTEDTEETTNG